MDSSEVGFTHKSETNAALVCNDNSKIPEVFNSTKCLRNIIHPDKLTPRPYISAKDTLIDNPITIEEYGFLHQYAFLSPRSIVSTVLPMIARSNANDQFSM